MSDLRARLEAWLDDQVEKAEKRLDEARRNDRDETAIREEERAQTLRDVRIMFAYDAEDEGDDLQAEHDAVVAELGSRMDLDAGLADIVGRPDYVGPTDVWWHIVYRDRRPGFVRGRAEAIRIAEETGAQFVQERGGERRIVWEAP